MRGWGWRSSPAAAPLPPPAAAVPSALCGPPPQKPPATDCCLSPHTPCTPPTPPTLTNTHTNTGVDGHQPARHPRPGAAAPRAPRPQGRVWAARPRVPHAGGWGSGLRWVGAGGLCAVGVWWCGRECSAVRYGGWAANWVAAPLGCLPAALPSALLQPALTVTIALSPYHRTVTVPPPHRRRSSRSTPAP